MLKVTDSYNRIWEIKANPWLPGCTNLTHRMLLAKHLPEWAEKFQRQAYEQSPEYQRELRNKAFDEMLKKSRG